MGMHLNNLFVYFPLSLSLSLQKSTLSANSGGGSDHGWSGTSFMLGGNIKGGRILGNYPDDLTSDSPLDIGTIKITKHQRLFFSSVFVLLRKVLRDFFFFAF